MTPFLWPIRVYYEDTDAGGVVYHSAYLNFMERARTEWVRALGFEQDELITQHNVIFAVTSLQIDFRQPARFNQKLIVSTEIEDLGKAKIVFRQTIARESDQQVLCEAMVRVASLYADRFKARPMPEIFRSKIITVEK